MKFNLVGFVKWKGKVIANGINGVFETTDLRIINILKNMRFQEIKEEEMIVPQNEIKVDEPIIEEKPKLKRKVKRKPKK